MSLRPCLPVLCFLASATLYLAQGPLHSLPLDDSWIHAALARTLAEGGGIGLVPGEPVGASTAPLWTFLLAGAASLTGEPVITGKVLGVLFTLGGLFILQRGFGAVAAWIGALLPAAAWSAVSGLEGGLAFALVSAALSLREGGRGDLAAFVGGLAATARPEALLFLPWLAAGPSLREVLRRSLFALLGPGAAALLQLHLHGLPLPTTFYAKIHHSRNPAGGQGLFFCLEAGRWNEAAALFTHWAWVHLALYLETLLRASPALLLLVGAGAAEALRARRCAWPALLVAVPLGIGILTPRPDFGVEDRYALFLHPAALVLAARGWRLLPERGALRTAAAVVIFLPLGLGVWAGSRRYGAELRNTDRLHVAMARWVARHVPPDTLVAAHDVGALAYFARVRLLDLEGIATPAVLPYKVGPAALLGYLQRRRPAYLILAPNWYPDLVRRTDLFRLVHRVAVPPEENLVAAGPLLLALKAHWR